MQEQPCENVYHVKSTGAMDYAEAGGMYDVLTGWETAHAASQRTNDVSLNSIRIVDLTTNSGVEYVSSTGLPIPGTFGSSPAPGNVTLAVKADCGIAGRSNRGRSFWIGVDKAMVSGSTFNSVQAGDIVAHMNQLMTAINGGGPWTMVVLSRRTGGALRANGVGVPILNWTLTDFVSDSMRRRLPGHNRHR